MKFLFQVSVGAVYIGTKYIVLAILVSAATGKYEMQRLRGQKILTQEKVKTAKLRVKNEYEKGDFETSSPRNFLDNSVDYIEIKQVLIKNSP